MMKLSARTLLMTAALGLAVVALGGCGGYTALYAAPTVSPKLAAIQVSRPDGRTGYLMGQYLDDDLGKTGGEQPLYRLLLKTTQLRIPRGVRVNNVASRYEVDLNTTYTLVEIATRKVMTTGLVKVVVTYDSADQPYAGIAAELDGQERAAEQTAQRIRLELAGFFANPVAPTQIVAASQLAAEAQAATFSERLQPATIQSPRERALGQPTPQSANADLFGQPLRGVTADSDASTSGPFAAPNDPVPATLATPALDPVPSAASTLFPAQ